MNARRGIAIVVVLLGLAACGGGSARPGTAPIAGEPAAAVSGSTTSATALPPFAGPTGELRHLFTRMRAAHVIQLGVRATGRSAEETRTEYSLNFTARGLTADTYAVTFRYDDVPEIPHIAHAGADESGGLDPCAVFD